ncbi:MAG: NAD(P)/FAD-dependent oxidoreductase [Ferruginibacter sp.]|nr:NAD(P)/FAD-dependent oxidoreductase [Ferruginibacter sp.]
MTDTTIYDVSIMGGGLAGLALSIQLSRLGYSVLLFEKETYPFHKVCGEYISMESWNFLEGLGVPLSQLNLPLIKELVLTAPDGTKLSAPLDLGGFGISRYTLDERLKNIAVETGVMVYENCKVSDVTFDNSLFSISASSGIFTTKVCCGSFGKRSNLDIKFKRPFTSKTGKGLNNYVGIKYHIRTDHPVDTIALHNFSNGYCGISRIENDQYCLCYLTTASNLKDNHHSIREMEEQVLYKNPHLREIFTESEWIFKEPITISQISFSKKKQVENHILTLGDAAGMITPLCGNGMSMALHSSKLATARIHKFLQQRIDRDELESLYTADWQRMFSKRLFIGRIIQSMFGQAAVTNIFVRVMKLFPSLTRWLIRQTHGQPF